MNEQHKTTIAICDTQPITAEGMKNLLALAADLEFLGATATLEAAMASIESAHVSNEAGPVPVVPSASPRTPDIIILDKGFGMRAVLDWIHDLKLADATPAVMVWGVSMTEAEALRLLQAGARGIIRKTSELTNLLACLRTVAAGRTWMEDCVFHESMRGGPGYPRSELTPREHQVLQLVEQGFKNKEIALELGIRPGTVKIHLKHIFEKTGVHGRYGLAISGLKAKGIVSLAS
jgi:DNA-binding NarL/FixJ family response regulator